MTQPEQQPNDTPQRIGPSLYRRGGVIYARVRVDGVRTFRSTGTNDEVTARKVLKAWKEEQVLKSHGIEPPSHALARKKMTVAEVVATYIEAGLPDRKMHKKAATTVETEKKAFTKICSYLGSKLAETITLKNLDDYRRWRVGGGYEWVQSGKNRKSRAGDRSVDLELQSLGNAYSYAVRSEKLKANPIADRTHYHSEKNTHHCREFAPKATELETIAEYLRQHGFVVEANLTLFLAFSGLRISEALRLTWDSIDRKQGIIHARRSKNGINPWVPILPEMESLLDRMHETSGNGLLLFPSVSDPEKPLPYQTFLGRLKITGSKLHFRRVRPHGLRSFFVTQCREAGLTDADIASLIGDRSGPAIISTTYGDVRSEHLQNQARRIRLLLRPSPPSTMESAADRVA
jgi:integrase